MDTFKRSSNEINKNAEMKANESFKSLFEKNLKAILFKEPYFTQFIKEVKANVKPIGAEWTDEERNKYTRYLHSFSISVKPDEIKRQMQSIREIQSHKFINFIKDCFKGGENMYYDMQIYIEDQVFKVHRIVIACFIPIIFYQLSRKERAEETRKIRLSGINAKAFNEIVTYMYIGWVQPTKETFMNVLEVAIKLMMHEFIEMWIEIYEQSLGTTTSRLLFRYRMAQQFGWRDYSRRLVQMLAINFENLILLEIFFKLTPQELLEIIKQDEIGVKRYTSLLHSTCGTAAVRVAANNDLKKQSIAKPTTITVSIAIMGRCTSEFVCPFHIDDVHTIISDYLKSNDYSCLFESDRLTTELKILATSGEVVVFIAVLKWLNHDWPHRECYALSLMSEIRFSCMSEEALFACLNPPILRAAIEIPQVKSAIADAINFVKNICVTNTTIKGERRYRSANSDNLKLWNPTQTNETTSKETDNPNKEIVIK